MNKVRLSRMASGHLLATFATDGKVTGTRVVGGTNDKLSSVYKHLATNFTVDQIGIKLKSRTKWLKPL